MSIVSANNYNVYIDENYDKLNELIEQLAPSQIFIIVDNNTERDCLPFLKKQLHQDFLSLRIPAGEKYKNLKVCEGLWDALIQYKADRKSLIINLGGGVIGDLGGFIAGTYMRGISFIQIPTTLLSQVDASVGGKLGIDHKSYKNMIGLFLEPELVWIDTKFLDTLPNRELRSGFAEIIKHALIRSKSLWNQLQQKDISQFNSNDWSSLVTDNVEIKNYVVKQDFKEGGLRKVLNFGHTIGHAIERHFLNTENPLTHGEAILLGMYCETTLSHQQGLLDNGKKETIHTFLKKVIIENRNLSNISDELILNMLSDKKNEGGEINFTLLDDIGSSVFNQNVEPAKLKMALNV